MLIADRLILHEKDVLCGGNVKCQMSKICFLGRKIYFRQRAHLILFIADGPSPAAGLETSLVLLAAPLRSTEDGHKRVSLNVIPNWN